jgi:hypothetical protein
MSLSDASALPANFTSISNRKFLTFIALVALADILLFHAAPGLNLRSRRAFSTSPASLSTIPITCAPLPLMSRTS